MLVTATPERARSLGQSLPARSREIEDLRRLPDDLSEALVDLGVFRMWLPESLGGEEATLSAGLEVIEELSYWDGAVGWCAMIGATTSIQAAFLPEPFARELYGDPRSITGGVAEPRGEAKVVDGGLEVDGRWAWGSGCHHCQWIGGGCRVLSSQSLDDAPRTLFVFFERQQVILHDTWHTVGLRGTGSGDFEVRGAFVPEGRWVELGVSPPLVESTLYRLPTFGPLALGVASVGLGLARRAIDELLQIATGKRYVGSRRTLAERPAVQAKVAESEAQRLAARAFLDRSVAGAWLHAERGELGLEDRRRIRLASTHAMQTSLQVVDRMFELAGGSAVFESCPLERTLRDVHVAATHGIVAARTFELAGRIALGLDTDVRQL